MKKVKSGSIKVEPSVLAAAKKICEREGLRISYYATKALIDLNSAYVTKAKEKVK